MPATIGYRPVFPGQRAPQKWVVLGLITRRSRVQIPLPLLKALVSDLLTGASTVPGHLMSDLSRSSHCLYQRFCRTYDLRVF